MTYTKEQLDGIGCLIDLMRSKGVTEFKAGDLYVTLGASADPITAMTTEDKLDLLKQELKTQSANADEDTYWSV